MEFMLVTLDVSRLGGWLNAYAYCAESKTESYRKEGGMWAEKGGVGRAV